MELRPFRVRDRCQIAKDIFSLTLEPADDQPLFEFKAGQFVTSQIKLAEAWGWNRETVAKFLRRLKIDKQIDYKTSNKFTIITICNWDSYQNPNKDKPATEPTAEPTPGAAN